MPRRRAASAAIITLILLASGSASGIPRAAPAPALECQRGRLNEVLPNSGRDWNGDGTADPGDDWIELHNAGASPWDLAGWVLDDGDAPYPDSSVPYTITERTVLAPGAYAVFYARDTGIDLHNIADSVRLLDPGGSPVDLFLYGATARDRSYSLNDECSWTLAFPPTPGRANGYLKLYLPLAMR
ncbi:MAG: lamin tail domain-containing protein [Anaerolineae bacterium]|nr:lamin tail domain-containing protein [Anaerolineae bacterium]